MFYIFPILFLLLIPLTVEFKFNKNDEFHYSVYLSVLWGLVIFRYSKGNPMILRISFFVVEIPEEKATSEEEKTREPKKKKKTGKPVSLTVRQWYKKLEFEKIFIYRRILTRTIRKLFQTFFITGMLYGRYSSGSPAMNGMSYGYLCPVLEFLNSKDFQIDIFPEFSRFDLYFAGRGRIRVKTFIFMFIYLASRLVKDAWIIKKEFIDGKDRRTAEAA